SHNRSAGHHAEGVKGDSRSVSVGIHDKCWLERSVILPMPHQRVRGVCMAFADGDAVTKGILRLADNEFVLVVVNKILGFDGIHMKRIARAMLQKEVLTGKNQLLGRSMNGVGREEQPSGGDPPSWFQRSGFIVKANITALILEH
ncbi:MAG: hypothetical protein GY697_07245, partial [Desulfobacterales bacterium]|nr:hypothetical protein [Desulfobacterales bacterium]